MRTTQDELQRIREMLSDRFLIGLSAFGVPALGLSFLRAVRFGWHPVFSTFTALVAALVLAAVLRRRLGYEVKVVVALLVLCGIGLLGAMRYGLLSASGYLLALGPLFCGLFLGWRAALGLGAVLVAVMAGFALNARAIVAAYPFNPVEYISSPVSWISHLAGFACVSSAGAYAFFGCFGELIKALEASRKSERELTESLERVRVANANAIQAQRVAMIALADLAEHRDLDTGDHVLRVARMTHEIAEKMRRRGVEPSVCDDSFVAHVGFASILHDVGKVTIPDSILLKAGPLDPEELARMRTHAENGAAILYKASRMLPESDDFRLAAQIAEAHHEQWDGTGYPRGLKGRDIPLAARITTVSDVFDALTSSRPYKAAWPFEEAVAHVRTRGGTQFDPEVVEAFLDVIRDRDESTIVGWTDSIATGHPAIDQDHRLMLQLISQLANPGYAADALTTRFMLDELEHYSEYHFRREEQLMRDSGYPRIASHLKRHAEMKTHLAELRDAYERREPALKSRVVELLTSWLKDHIMVADRDYLPWISVAVKGGDAVPLADPRA